MSAESDLDFRGTLEKEASVGFAEIRLRFDLDTDGRRTGSTSWLKLTERDCVVYPTIKSGPTVDVRMARR